MPSPSRQQVVRDRTRADEPISTAGLVVRFTAAGLVVLVSLAVLIAFAARRAGTSQAVDSARQVTLVAARGIVEPRLDAELLAGDAAALSRFDREMHRYVLHDSLVRIKLWNSSARVVYSDEARLIGDRFALDPGEQATLRQQGSDSGVSDLSRPENRFERPYGKLLEVHVGLRDQAGAPMLFEAYFRYDAVKQAGLSAWREFAPPSLGALLGLEVVQIPFAWTLVRRLQRQQRERERLLRHAVDASNIERRRIAGELHDGVVQDLSGVTFVLDAARLSRPGEQRRAEVIDEAATQLRSSVGALRSLLVDIYPPNLAEEGLPIALTELVGRLERGGIRVDVDVAGTETLPQPCTALLFRCAQEALRNVAAHSNASQVEITARVDDGVATLVVDDDGRGFDESELVERTGSGHLGLRSLGDLLADSGGRLAVRSAPGQGTRVEAEVPIG